MVLVMVQCLAQVPDSLQEQMPMPVFQKDTVPVIPAADSLHPNIALESLQADSVSTALSDTIEPKRKSFLYRTFKSDYPNPNKALYFSLIIPGGGQLYNKRWWKAPIVWGGYAALIYSASYNTKGYKIFKKEYIDAANGRERRFPNLNAGDVKRLRDQYDKRKQLSYIGMFGLHIMQAAEAFVDCHLKTFDVSDDLSLHLKPSLEASFVSAYPVVGVGVAVSIVK